MSKLSCIRNRRRSSEFRPLGRRFWRCSSRLFLYLCACSPRGRRRWRSTTAAATASGMLRADGSHLRSWRRRWWWRRRSSAFPLVLRDARGLCTLLLFNISLNKVRVLRDLIFRDAHCQQLIKQTLPRWVYGIERRGFARWARSRRRGCNWRSGRCCRCRW